MLARLTACADDLEREPATRRPLCRGCLASDALSPPRPEVSWLDLAACVGSSPTRARGRAPFVDFCHRCDPQARSSDLRNPGRCAWLFASRPRRSAAGSRASPCERGSTRPWSRVAPGQGPCCEQHALARCSGALAPRWLAVEALPQPELTRTPHVAPVARRRAGEALLRRGAPASSSNEFVSSPPAAGLRRRPRQGRLPRLLAKGDVIRCTQGAFRPVNSVAGGAQAPGLATRSVWASASSISAASHARTCDGGSRDSAAPRAPRLAPWNSRTVTRARESSSRWPQRLSGLLRIERSAARCAAELPKQ